MTLTKLPARPRSFALVCALLALSSAAIAQQATPPRAGVAPGSAGEIERLRADVESLRQGQEEIKKTLDEIKTMLRDAPAPARPAAPAAPPDVTIDLASRPVLGSGDAKIAVIEFSDYQCPYCARHTRDTYPLLDEAFIKTGKIRYAMLDLPLRNHPFAFKAAEAATCAASEGKFWEMHHLLFEKQHALQPDALPTYAAEVGLDRARFEACLEEGREDDVNADLARAREAGVSATPTFLIGWIENGDKVKVAQVIRGAQPYENFERVLTQMLADGPPEADAPEGKAGAGG
jgi:protein-disulfide isomerase